MQRSESDLRGFHVLMSLAKIVGYHYIIECLVVPKMLCVGDGSAQGNPENREEPSMALRVI